MPTAYAKRDISKRGRGWVGQYLERTGRRIDVPYKRFIVPYGPEGSPKKVRGGATKIRR
jgi:hypothetical protein